MKRTHELILCTALVTVLLMILLPVRGSIGQDRNKPREQEPFKMLVLGDSIVWGQGLSEPEKFSSLIAKDIESLLGREVDVVNKSHSGATIIPRYKGSLKEHQEVPIPSPTLWEQFDSSIPGYECVERGGVEKRNGRKKVVCGDVDLILLDGCINDVALERILNPFTGSKKIEKLSREYCFEEMTKLLAEIASTFVNAKIVVTGYYPIISRGKNGTPPNLVTELVRAFLTRSKVRAARKASQKGPSGWIVRKLAKRSAAWNQSSDQSLSDSINKTNTDARKTIAHFIKIDFNPSESYAAADTKLWKLERFDASRTPLTNDRMLRQRIDVYCPPAKKHLDKIKMKSWFRFLLKSICNPAGAGHPNVEGALKYREAIWKALHPLLAQTQ